MPAAQSFDFSVSFMSGGEPLQVAVPAKATVAGLKEEIHRLRPDLPCVQLFSVELGEDALKDADAVGSLGLASGAGLFAMEQEQRYATIVLAKLRRWGSAFDEGESEWPYVIFDIPSYLQSWLFILISTVFLASWVAIAASSEGADLAANIMLAVTAVICTVVLVFLFVGRLSLLVVATGQVLASSCRCLHAQVMDGDSRHQRIRWSFGVGNILAVGTQTTFIILALLFFLDSVMAGLVQGSAFITNAGCVSFIWTACCGLPPTASPTAAPTAAPTPYTAINATNATALMPTPPPPPWALALASDSPHACWRKLALSVALPSGIFGTLVALGLAHSVAMVCSKVSQIGGVGVQDEEEPVEGEELAVAQVAGGAGGGGLVGGWRRWYRRRVAAV
jgi:hypothetical protein